MNEFVCYECQKYTSGRCPDHSGVTVTVVEVTTTATGGDLEPPPKPTFDDVRKKLTAIVELGDEQSSALADEARDLLNRLESFVVRDKAVLERAVKLDCEETAAINLENERLKNESEVRRQALAEANRKIETLRMQATEALDAHEREREAAETANHRINRAMRILEGRD